MYTCLGNSFRFQGRLHHGMHEAIVQWRIVVVFKHQRIYGYRLSLPAYSPSSSPCRAVNSHPVSFLYSRGRIPSSPQQVGECAKLHKPPPSLRLRGKLLLALQIQSTVAFSATATCGISFPPTRMRIISWRPYSTRTGQVGSSRLITQL